MTEPLLPAPGLLDLEEIKGELRLLTASLHSVAVYARRSIESNAPTWLAALVGEVERLRAEDDPDWRADVEATYRQRNELRAERDALKAELADERTHTIAEYEKDLREANKACAMIRAERDALKAQLEEIEKKR